MSVIKQLKNKFENDENYPAVVAQDDTPEDESVEVESVQNQIVSTIDEVALLMEDLDGVDLESDDVDEELLKEFKELSEVYLKAGEDELEVESLIDQSELTPEDKATAHQFLKLVLKNS